MDANLSENRYSDENYTTTPYFYDTNPFDGFPHSVQTHGAVFGVILTIWTVFLNLLVIMAILCEKRTRTDLYFLQIMNMSLASFLIGIFVIPITVYSILYPWNLGAVLCKTWIIFDVCLPFASMITLFLINIDRLILMTYPKLYICLFQTCLKPIILMIPWMLSLVIVVPLWTHGALPYELLPGECIIMIMHSAAVAGSIITYFAPLSLIIFLTLKILIARLQFDRTYSSASTTSDRSALKLSTFSTTADQIVNEIEEGRMKIISSGSIIAVCLANFLFCSMWFPYQFVSLLMTVCSSLLCIPSTTLSQAVTWAATASAGIVPLVWFADKKMKRSCIKLVCRTRTTDHEDITEDNV